MIFMKLRHSTTKPMRWQLNPAKPSQTPLFSTLPWKYPLLMRPPSSRHQHQPRYCNATWSGSEGHYWDYQDCTERRNSWHYCGSLHNKQPLKAMASSMLPIWKTTLYTMYLFRRCFQQSHLPSNKTRTFNNEIDTSSWTSSHQILQTLPSSTLPQSCPLLLMFPSSRQKPSCQALGHKGKWRTMIYQIIRTMQPGRVHRSTWALYKQNKPQKKAPWLKFSKWCMGPWTW